MKQKIVRAVIFIIAFLFIAIILLVVLRSMMANIQIASRGDFSQVIYVEVGNLVYYKDLKGEIHVWKINKINSPEVDADPQIKVDPCGEGEKKWMLYNLNGSCNEALVVAELEETGLLKLTALSGLLRKPFPDEAPAPE